MNIPTLHSCQLTLRPLTPADAEALYEIYQGQDVLKYFPNPTPPTPEKIARFLQHAQAHWEKYGYGNWGLAINGDPGLIGWAGLEYLPELNETEVGFLLGRQYWGRGYATQAAMVALYFGFACHHLDHLIALVHPGNLASRRVLEKCGLAYQQTMLLWGLQVMRYRLENLYLGDTSSG